MDDLKQLKLVNENAWPQSVRKLLNQCATMLNRKWTVTFEDVKDGKVLQSDGNVKIVLPNPVLNTEIPNFSLSMNNGQVTVKGGNISAFSGTTLNVSGALAKYTFAGTVSSTTVYYIDSTNDGDSTITGLSFKSTTGDAPANSKILGTADASGILTGDAGIGDQNITCCAGSVGYNS